MKKKDNEERILIILSQKLVFCFSKRVQLIWSLSCAWRHNAIKENENTLSEDDRVCWMLKEVGGKRI